MQVTFVGFPEVDLDFEPAAMAASNSSVSKPLKKLSNRQTSILLQTGARFLLLLLLLVSALHLIISNLSHILINR